ncbi:MAG: hypothetical protein AVDCRST_MAG60-1314, partial [uncultured Nocardioides sp.]
DDPQRSVGEVHPPDTGDRHLELHRQTVDVVADGSRARLEGVVGPRVGVRRHPHG